MLSEASRHLLKLKSTDEYCYILFSAFNKFAEEPKYEPDQDDRITDEELNAEYEKMDEDLVEIEKQL